MNTMTYKGYTARVEYDERDNLFIGRILGIRNIISFHGETVAQLRAEFELAIKDYLADCKEQGIHPEKPASGKLLLRRWRRMSVVMLWSGLAVLGLLGFEALPHALLRSLENRYPVPSAQVVREHAGVIVLGGAIGPSLRPWAAR